MYNAVNSAGDRITDFSSAGYGGGGVPFPNFAVLQTLSPSGGDDSAALQSALDNVGRQVQSQGLAGGTLLLTKGTFKVSSTISLGYSNVILRGNSSSTTGTILNYSDAPASQAFAVSIGGSASISTKSPTTNIQSSSSSYIPAGSTLFPVASTSGFAIGNAVVVCRVVTDAWIHFMGMDTLVRDGKPQTWLKAGNKACSERNITHIATGFITVDKPIADNFNLSLITAFISAYSVSRLSNIGFQSIRLTTPATYVNLNDAFWSAMTISAQNVWLNNVVAEEFLNGFDISSPSRYVTFKSVSITRSGSYNNSAGSPGHFSTDAENILFDSCQSVAGSSVGTVFALTTWSLSTGPIVALKMKTSGATPIQPHMRWSTGILVDNAEVGSAIQFINRGIDGSGHGWTSGASVAWNSVSDTFTLQMPPGSWTLGAGLNGTYVAAKPPGSSTTAPEGIVDTNGHGGFVAPNGLYLAQLYHAKGLTAVQNIGYAAQDASVVCT